MKTVITIECNHSSDLQSVLGLIISELGRGYVKASGVLPAKHGYVPVQAAPPPAPPQSVRPSDPTAEDYYGGSIGLAGQAAPMLTSYDYEIEE